MKNITYGECADEVVGEWLDEFMENERCFEIEEANFPYVQILSFMGHMPQYARDLDLSETRFKLEDQIKTRQKREKNGKNWYNGINFLVSVNYNEPQRGLYPFNTLTSTVKHAIKGGREVPDINPGSDWLREDFFNHLDALVEEALRGAKVPFKRKK